MCNCKRCRAPKQVRKCKPMNCGARVKAETQLCPTLSTSNYCQTGSYVDVALDVCAKPCCRVIPKCKTSRTGANSHSCGFRVKIDCPFKCKPRIVKQGPNPSASFDVNVGIDSNTICKTKPNC